MTGLLGALRFRFDHRFTRRHASEFLDGELLEDDHRRVARHLALCPECARLIATLRATITALAGLRARSDASVAAGVISHLRQDP